MPWPTTSTRRFAMFRYATMTMTRPRVFSIALIGLGVACLSCEVGVDPLIEDVIDELNEQVAIYCGDCADELGFDSQTACEHAHGLIGPSRRRCMTDAFKRDKAASDDFLSCVEPLEEEFTSCVRSRLECTDLSTDDPCIDDYNVGKDRCIVLPNVVERALDDCFPEGRDQKLMGGDSLQERVDAVTEIHNDLIDLWCLCLIFQYIRLAAPGAGAYVKPACAA